MLNSSIIMGRLARDPELRATGSGVSVCSFTVAVDRDYSQNGERNADFIDCVAWMEAGEFVARNFTKGSMIVVSGRLQMRGWTDKEGNKRRTAEIVADDVYFGEARKRQEAAGAGPGGNAYPGALSGAGQDASRSGEFAPIEDDDPKLPF